MHFKVRARHSSCGSLQPNGKHKYLFGKVASAFALQLSASRLPCRLHVSTSRLPFRLISGQAETPCLAHAAHLTDATKIADAAHVAELFTRGVRFLEAIICSGMSRLQAKRCGLY